MRYAAMHIISISGTKPSAVYLKVINFSRSPLATLLLSPSKDRDMFTTFSSLKGFLTKLATYFVDVTHKHNSVVR